MQISDILYSSLAYVGISPDFQHDKGLVSQIMYNLNSPMQNDIPFSCALFSYATCLPSYQLPSTYQPTYASRMAFKAPSGKDK